MNLLYSSYYDKVSKNGTAKIGDFGRKNKMQHFKEIFNGRLGFLYNTMFSDWHQHFKEFIKF